MQTCRSRVSLESRKGTCGRVGSALALMHMPRVVSDRLMLLASVARSPAVNFFIRQDPSSNIGNLA